MGFPSFRTGDLIVGDFKFLSLSVGDTAPSPDSRIPCRYLKEPDCLGSEAGSS